MNDDKKDISYHGKTPDQILSELDEKKEMNRSKIKKSRRPLLFLSVSVLLITVVFLIYYLYKFNSQTVEYMAKSGSAVVRIVSEKEYLYGDPINISVKLSNSSSRELEIEISDFEFYITNVDDGNEYSFKYPPGVKVTLDRYDSRDVFNFARENPYFTLNPGEYTVESRVKIGGETLNMVKTFLVTEQSGVEFVFFDDYLNPGQQLESYIRVKNYSPETSEFEFGNYSVSFTKDGEQIYGIRSDFDNATYVLKSDERIDVPLEKFQVPDIPGEYELIYSYFLNDALKDGKRSLIVHDTSIDVDFNKIRILPYSLKVMGEGGLYEAEFYVVNDSGKTVYETVESVFFSISKGGRELFRYTSDPYRKLNIIIQPYSKRIFFSSKEWRTLELVESGEYEVKMILKLHGKQLEYSEILNVLPKTNE